MKRSPAGKKSKKSKGSEFVTREKFKSKLRKLKLELEDLKTFRDEVEEFVRVKNENFIHEKLDEEVKRRVEKELENVYDKVKGKVVKGYIDDAKSVAESTVASHIKKCIKWEIKSVKLNEIHNVGGIEKMYKEGWKVCFVGKLRDEEYVMFEKPLLEEDLKKKQRSKKKGSKKKKKIERTPT